MRGTVGRQSLQIEEVAGLLNTVRVVIITVNPCVAGVCAG